MTSDATGVRTVPVCPAGGEDQVVEETAVALVYNGVSHVVMMATPADLEDFALGFSLSERILDGAEQLYGVDIVSHPRGIEIQMEVAAPAFARLKARRRNLVGRTGCGLCGAESLDQALPEPRTVTRDFGCESAALRRAVGELDKRQPLKQTTGSVHAAAYCGKDGRIIALREDVGRHNELDKLIGGLARAAVAEPGFVLVTSRASYEMVAKTAAANVPLLAAVSAPTSLAIEQAEACGITLVGHLSSERHVVYCGAHRIAD
jgi:FdhD protein